MGWSGLATGGAKRTTPVARRYGRRTNNYTLELYQFLTTDPAVPEHLRQQLAELGLCRDEVCRLRPLVAAALRA